MNTTTTGQAAAQQIGGLAVADYTPATDGDARRCTGHRTDNTAGYVVRRTIGDDGEQLTDPATGRLGIDVYAIASEPGRGGYDKALTVARQYREHRLGGSWALIDTLYRCGHRGRG